MEVFKRVLECINYMDPEIGEKMSRPLDLNVQSRTLQRYGDLVGRVLKKVLESLVMKNEIETEKQFLKIVLKHISAGSFQSNENTVELALNVLDSISDFYAIAAQDKSRTGISTRKLVLQAITGNKVQNSHQISLLSEIVGARYMTIFKEAENRKLLDEHQKLLPFIEMLRRKTPQGARFIPEKTRLDVIEFYEKDHISDILKGHNNMHKETIETESGTKAFLNRPKRVLKLHLVDLLAAAQKEIGFQFSLRSLMSLRPPWVYLAREAHSLTCLCDRCQNVLLILRSICNFVQRVRQHGSPVEKASILSFELSTSLSEFVSRVLHPKQECSLWHDRDCFYQTCQSTDESPCGPAKLALHFKPLLKKFGSAEIQLFQHERVKYTKVDGSTGSKFDQVETRQEQSKVVSLLNDRMFGKIHRQPYVLHRFKMLLASKMRQEIHQNLTEKDAICYTDYSKELELTDQEQCKSELYGASNITKGRLHLKKKLKLWNFP